MEAEVKIKYTDGTEETKKYAGQEKYDQNKLNWKAKFQFRKSNFYACKGNFQRIYESAAEWKLVLQRALKMELTLAKWA